jgi:GNAT superfamily N-acetyltransferase
MLEIIPLQEEHLEDAAALVCSRYKDLREGEPLLPYQYQEPKNIQPLLHNIMMADVPGVAAVQDGQLAGFLTGWLMPEFRGKRSVYSPEWANAARVENSRTIYEEMYRQIAAEWVGEKYVAHYISISANDPEAIRACHWLGFGMLGMDALRGLQPIKEFNKQIVIRRAGIQDIDKVFDLHIELVAYMKNSPIFFIAEKLSKGYFEEWVNDPDKAIWLAYVDEEPVAFLRMGPANDDVSKFIYDKKTTSIYGAYTRGKMRGKDVMTSLLGYALKCARDDGYERCAVDFETMNLLGTRFWLGRGFRPVSFSLLRYVDERSI